MLAFMFLIVNIESYNYLYNYCWHFTFTSHYFDCFSLPALAEE